VDDHDSRGIFRNVERAERGMDSSACILIILEIIFGYNSSPEI
jgi:hypothetical protein